MPGNELALELAARCINQALATDPAARNELARLAGRRFAVNATLPPLSVVFEVVSERVVLTSSSEHKADVELSGSALALLKLALGLAADQADFSSSGVTLEGDVALLMQLSRALAKLDIDWEALLGEWFGEMPARFLFMGLEQLQQTRPAVHQALVSQGRTIAVEQCGLLSADDFAQLQRRARDLSYRIDRIEALAKLAQPS